MAALAAGAALAVGTPAAAAASSEPSAGAAAVGEAGRYLEALDRQQSALLRNRAVRMRVRAPFRSVARVQVGLRVGSGPPGAFTATRELSFERPGARVVSLPLSATALRRLRGCGLLRLRLVVRFRRPDGRRLRARVWVVVRLDRGRCPPEPPPAVQTADADRCDFIDPSACLFPWPNDHFTVADRSTATGRRLNIAAASTPANKDGTRVDPKEWNRNDGFSPGQPLVTRLPGLDTPEAFRRSGLVPETDVAQSLRRDQPAVLIDAATGARQLIWAELDANASAPATTALLIHAARNLREGRRYVVALRGLEDAQGKAIAPSRAFRYYRDRVITRQRAVERRRSHFERIFRELRRGGVARRDLVVAWDFTVASERNLTERLLSIRDESFARLGDTNLADLRVQGAAPPFTVDAAAAESAGKTYDFLPCGADGCQAGESDRIARRVTGTFTVPCYLDQQGCPPGARFNYARAGDRTPSQQPGNTWTGRYICKIPRATLDGAVQTGSRPSLYGHGLLGGAGEVNQGQLQDFGFEHKFVFCAADEIGMASEDIPNAVAILQDLGKFPSLVDRLQQGMLNFYFLGRLMIHPAGLSSDPAFRVAGASTIDTTRLFYDGNSQGAIFGGALAAAAPDHDRAVLGVASMQYSTLLTRSVDFDVYKSLLYPAYTSELDRPLLLSMLQNLWDRGETNGYAHHMTDDPLPNTPPHRIMLHVAVGDHQVAPVTAEIEARTIGAGVVAPALDPGRSPDVTPFYAIPAITTFPHQGSALVQWDSGPLRDGGTLGTPWQPTTNLPPRVGNDPHELPRRAALARRQKSDFLRVGGTVTNPCAPKPCYAGGWTGP